MTTASLVDVLREAEARHTLSPAQRTSGVQRPMTRRATLPGAAATPSSQAARAERAFTLPSWRFAIAP